MRNERTTVLRKLGPGNEAVDHQPVDVLGDLPGIALAAVAMAPRAPEPHVLKAVRPNQRHKVGREEVGDVRTSAALHLDRHVQAGGFAKGVDGARHSR